MITLFVISIVIFLLAVTRQLLAFHTFFTYLETAHPKTYQALGYPRWRIQFGNTILRDAIRYIHTRGFASLNDPRLEAIYQSVKRAEKIAYISAATALFSAIMDALGPML